MNKIIFQRDINLLAPEIRGKKVLVGGCFDVIHPGHVDFLHEAKALGDVVIILLESDKTITKLKGQGRPIQTQEDRAHILSHLECADIIVRLNANLSDLDYSKLVKVLKPDIIALTKGDPITDIKRAYAKEVNGSIAILEKKGNYSTRNIVEKIKKT